VSKGERGREKRTHDERSLLDDLENRSLGGRTLERVEVERDDGDTVAEVLDVLCK
jgi:hypothetical protein